jgi:hypothetical protein
MPTFNTEALMAKLFSWKTVVEFEGSKFPMRVVSDHVIDDARRYALIESRKLRRSLRDENSDDFLIHIDPLRDLDVDDYLNLIIFSAVRDTMRTYMSNNPRPVIEPLGDNPSQEEQENHEADKEKRDEEYIVEMQAYMKSWQDEFKIGLERKTKDQLEILARRYRTDTLCEELFSAVFEEYIVAASIYTDEKYKERMFSLEQFKNLPMALRVKLIDAYRNLNITAEDVKN